MSNAVVIPFPSSTPAPETPRTLEEIARAYLDAKRAAEEAEATMEALAPELIALMQSEEKRGVSVSGAGRVSLVVSEGSTRLDQRAAVAALITAGLEVPVTPVAGGTSLRASLD